MTSDVREMEQYKLPFIFPANFEPKSSVVGNEVTEVRRDRFPARLSVSLRVSVRISYFKSSFSLMSVA